MNIANLVKRLVKRFVRPIQSPDEEERQRQSEAAAAQEARPRERQDEDREACDAFQYADEVERQLERHLKKIYGGRGCELAGKTLVLWIEDDGKRGLVDRCHDRLLYNLNKTHGLPVAEVKTVGEQARKGATLFYDGMAFTIDDENATDLTINNLTARLSVSEGKGTLMGGAYTLVADGGFYSIGRGATGRGAIGIAADETDPNYDLNKYVRSRHARIKYFAKAGFCLFVERDGTQAFGGSRTQLRHPNGNVEDLNNPQQPVPLRDGDVIVLGKSVELLFETEK